MTREREGLAASIRQRLYNKAKATGEDLNLMLVQFANERWLYRLSISPHRDKFYLKGASRLNLWFDKPHRPTRDIDLLGFGPSEIAAVRQIVIEICEIARDDGLDFRVETLTVEETREAADYGGVRARFLGYLGGARIGLQIDIGFGDAVTPAPESVVMPSMLDFPSPDLLAYPKETVVAEKFEAMVKLGIANSRMKDFLDLNLLIAAFEFDGATMMKALKATFDRRRTRFPLDIPLALTLEFASDRTKQSQWKAFLVRSGINEEHDLKLVIETLARFFSPLIEAELKAIAFGRVWDKNKWKRL